MTGGLPRRVKPYAHVADSNMLTEIANIDTIAPLVACADGLSVSPQLLVVRAVTANSKGIPTAGAGTGSRRPCTSFAMGRSYSSIRACLQNLCRVLDSSGRDIDGFGGFCRGHGP